jgi:hypothetical protein
MLLRGGGGGGSLLKIFFSQDIIAFSEVKDNRRPLRYRYKAMQALQKKQQDAKAFREMMASSTAKTIEDRVEVPLFYCKSRMQQ